MLCIKISDVPVMVNLCRKSKNNLLIVGDPGVGKSQTILDMESEHCKVTMLTGSSTYEETANGIPRDNKETKKQDYTRPSWFAEMLEWADTHTGPEDYQILFIDEFNTADPQVLKTFLSILSERKIPTQPEKIPDQVVMVAAMNPCYQNEGEELIRPMASRFATVQITATIDGYKNYILGEEDTDKLQGIEVSDKEKEVEHERLAGYLDQVVEDDWQKFEPGTYHEINPRAFSNFFRALNWVVDKKAASPLLSMAFLGKTYRFPDSMVDKKRKIEERAEKVRKGSVIPNREELEAMDTEALKGLKKQMMLKGAKGMTCVANIIEILTERGE